MSTRSFIELLAAETVADGLRESPLGIYDGRLIEAEGNFGFRLGTIEGTVIAEVRDAGRGGARIMVVRRKDGRGYESVIVEGSQQSVYLLT
jgi:hypothetical protein